MPSEPGANEELIEQDVLREMTVQLITVPEFKPHIKAEDLEDFETRDQKVLLTMSLIEQKLDFTIKCILDLNRGQRQMEAQRIRQRRQFDRYVEEQKREAAEIAETRRRIQWGKGLLKWTT